MQEALATAAIEGEQLNLEPLRSSVAHRLRLADAPGADRSVEGLVQVMQDALANHIAALDLDRLCCWQSALFPGGTSGITRIAVERVRSRADAMQIVSGIPGRGGALRSATLGTGACGDGQFPGMVCQHTPRRARPCIHHGRSSKRHCPGSTGTSVVQVHPPV